MGCCGSSNATTVNEVPKQEQKGVQQAQQQQQVKKRSRDDYLVTKTLGTGASCQVVAASNKQTNQKCAIKIMAKRGTPEAADSEYLFRNEIKILSSLRHPNILEYVENFEDDSSFYLVTVLCEGGELFDRVSEGSFTERVASKLTRQMLLALEHCHERNISHRDLKPENFVFSSKKEDSPMKLIDFGCAVQARDDELINDVAGSPYYVAPEVLVNFKRTGKIWKAADMWSIGVIIFLLVHGYPPFNGERQEQIFQKIKLGRYKFSKDISLSASVKDLITKLLELKPEKRMTAAEALAHPWIAQAASVAPDTPIDPSVMQSMNQFRTQCRLKKAVGRALASRMTDADKQTLEAVFKQFDLNGDGRLSADEIAAMMKHIGRTEGEAKEFMQAIDENNDGMISKEEFATGYAVGKLNDDNDIKKSFDLFDKDHDGQITIKEIENMCDFLSPDMAKQLVAEVDKNGDGVINLDEWIQGMREFNKPKG